MSDENVDYAKKAAWERKSISERNLTLERRDKKFRDQNDCVRRPNLLLSKRAFGNQVNDLFGPAYKHW